MKLIVRSADADETGLGSLYDWINREEWQGQAPQIDLGSHEAPDNTLSGGLHEFLTIVGVAKGGLDFAAIVYSVGEWIRAHRQKDGVVFRVEGGKDVEMRDADPETLAAVVRILAADAAAQAARDGGPAGA